MDELSATISRLQKGRAIKAGRKESQAIYDARDEDLAEVYAQVGQKGFAQQVF